MFNSVHECLISIQQQVGNDTDLDLEMVKILFQDEVFARIPDVLLPEEMEQFTQLIAGKENFQESDIRQCVSAYPQLLNEVVADFLSWYMVKDIVAG